MNRSSPADRDRAQQRVRSITALTAVGAGVLAVGGAAASAVTFGGRTVSAAEPAAPASTDPAAQPTDAGGLQQPAQPPLASGPGIGDGAPPVTSSGS